MNSPFFTIILPTYNCSELLQRALESVFEQTYTDYEVIVIDNSSTDNTQKYLSGIKDQRLQVLSVTNDGIIAYSRNKGIGLAKGQWLAFLDSDDAWFPSKLEKTYETIINNPDTIFVCHDCDKIVNGKSVGRITPGPIVNNMHEQLIVNFSILPTSAVALKLSVARKTNGFSEKREYASVEDYEYWIRLSGEGVFLRLPEVLGEYHVHGQNESGKSAIHAKALLSARLHHLQEWEKEFPEIATKDIVKIAKSNISLRAAMVYLKSYDFSLASEFAHQAFSLNKLNFRAYLVFLLSVFKIRANYNKELNMIVDDFKP